MMALSTRCEAIILEHSPVYLVYIGSYQPKEQGFHNDPRSHDDAAVRPEEVRKLEDPLVYSIHREFFARAVTSHAALAYDRCIGQGV